MMANPKPGQLVRVHYAKRYAHTMPLHGKVGRVVVVCKARKCRNHGVDIDGVMWVIPCGNLHKVKEEDMAKATVSINGREMGDLDELMANPTTEFKEAMGKLVTGAVATPSPQAAQPRRFDYTQIDEGIRDEVKDAAAAIHAHGTGVLASIIAIGKRLIEVKGMLPHGQFTDWIVAEFDLSERTAQNYMNVAKEFDSPQKRNAVSVFSPKVAYLLAAPSTPEEVREAVAVKFAETGKPPTHAEVKRLRDAAKPTPAPALAKPTYVEPAPKTPPDLIAAGYEIVKDGDAWGWIRKGDHKVDAYKQYPLNETISHFRTGKPFDQVAAIEEARRDMIGGVKMGPHESYYPEKHGLAIMPADLVAAGYELVDGDGDDSPGIHGYRWRFGSEIGPDVAYGGAAIEGARLHLQASAAPIPAPIPEPPPTGETDPIVHDLIHADLKSIIFADTLRIATAQQLGVAARVVGESDWRRYITIENRKQLFKAEAHTDVIITDRMAAAAEAMPADDAPDDDELAAIAIVEAEVVEEDEQRAARDETRASYERVPTPDNPLSVDNAGRLDDAVTLRYMLAETREAARRLYGDLTGHHTDMLEFERGVEKMLPRLDSLINVLGGEIGV